MSNSTVNLEIIPRKVRLLWEINESFRKFYWFEMQDKDLYWGASGKTSKNFVSQDIEGSGSVEISIPPSISFDEKTNMKFSYHQSGVVHIKQETNNKSEYDEISKWVIKEEIHEPKRFFVLISKTINHYEIYNKESTKGNANAIVFRLGPDDLEKRHYFEFFISPEGTYKFPEPILKIKNDFIESQPVTCSLSNDFILVIRQFILAELDDWHPDKEMFFIPKDI